MSFKHKFKLIFSRMRWHARLVREAFKYSERVRVYKRLTDLQKQAHENYLIAQRKEHENKDLVLELKGELQMINRILYGN